jgi:hypothetical protein
MPPSSRLRRASNATATVDGGNHDDSDDECRIIDSPAQHVQAETGFAAHTENAADDVTAISTTTTTTTTDAVTAVTTTALSTVATVYENVVHLHLKHSQKVMACDNPRCAMVFSENGGGKKKKKKRGRPSNTGDGMNESSEDAQATVIPTSRFEENAKIYVACRNNRMNTTEDDELKDHGVHLVCEECYDTRAYVEFPSMNCFACLQQYVSSGRGRNKSACFLANIDQERCFKAEEMNNASYRLERESAKAKEHAKKASEKAEAEIASKYITSTATRNDAANDANDANYGNDSFDDVLMTSLQSVLTAADALAAEEAQSSLPCHVQESEDDDGIEEEAEEEACGGEHDNDDDNASTNYDDYNRAYDVYGDDNDDNDDNGDNGDNGDEPRQDPQQQHTIGKSPRPYSYSRRTSTRSRRSGVQAQGEEQEQTLPSQPVDLSKLVLPKGRTARKKLANIARQMIDRGDACVNGMNLQAATEFLTEICKDNAAKARRERDRELQKALRKKRRDRVECMASKLEAAIKTVGVLKSAIAKARRKISLQCWYDVERILETACTKTRTDLFF